MSMMVLRPYQKDIVEGVWTAHQQGSRNVLATGPTGMGKTALFAALTAAWSGAGLRTCILVHRRELLGQASKALFRIGVEHGFISPGRMMTRDMVQVASVDTLLARMSEMAPLLERFDRVITDEAHHAVAGKWSTVRQAMTKAIGLGVTATPFRADGRGLGDAFDTAVKGPTVRFLMDEGFLKRAVVYHPPAQVDLSKVRSRGGDYVASDLAKVVDRAEVTLPAVEWYRRLCDGVPAVAFCASVEHAQHVAEQFSAAGYRAASVDGTMRETERDAAIAGLGNGRLNVLTSCDIISEGTDIPIVTAAINLRPSQSTGLVMQQDGRTFRPIPGKPDAEAIIIDIVGNIAVHGMLDADRPWTLEGGLKGLERAVPATRRCRYCFVRCEQGSTHCPRCSRSYGLPKQSAASTLRKAEPIAAAEPDKSLGMLTDAQIERMTTDACKRIARTEADLQRVARIRKFRPGWVKFVLAERGGYARFRGR